MTTHVYQTLKSVSLKDLRQLNREFGLPTTGNQASLIKRLMIVPKKQSGGSKETTTPEADYYQIGHRLEGFLELYGDLPLEELKAEATEAELKLDYTPKEWYQILYNPKIQTKKEPAFKKLPKFVAKLLDREQKLGIVQSWLASYGKNYTIEELTKLKWLDLTDNQIQVIPPEIEQLTNLVKLILSYNQITQIPPEIGQLTNLKWLYLYHNQITEIPREIGQLINLEILYLARNQITEIPPEIGQLTNLKELYLDYNQNLMLDSALRAQLESRGTRIII